MRRRKLHTIAAPCLALSLWAPPGGGAEPALTKGLTAVHPPVPAPDFTLKDMDGKAHRLAGWRGKAVILNFWATWCPPCRKEMPSMERAWRKLREEKAPVVLVAVNVGEDADTIFGFTAQMDLSFPILLDERSEVADRYRQLTGIGTMALPTTFVIDPEGRVVYRAVGGREWDDPALLARVRALVPPGAGDTAPAPGAPTVEPAPASRRPG